MPHLPLSTPVDFCALPAASVTPVSPRVPGSFLLLIPGAGSLGPHPWVHQGPGLGRTMERPEELWLPPPQSLIEGGRVMTWASGFKKKYPRSPSWFAQCLERWPAD